ncbi:MAG TPA: dihydrolipoamide acetyltransferase family protein [Chloroflexota bacterium]|nr:dihydrolipoamide acetyltransferase family protein [Chloroflexota bacterium]
MATSITMPQLGESVTEGTIGRWLKSVGDRVERDEPLVEVITDKVNVELPSPEAGTLAVISVDEGQTVPVGTEICQLEPGTVGSGPGDRATGRTDQPASRRSAAGDGATGGRGDRGASAVREPEPTGVSAETGGPTPATPGGGEEQRPDQAPAVASAEAVASAGADGGPAGDGRTVARTSPLVRRLAKEHGVDLAEVPGTGLGGRVTREDIQAFIAQRGGVGTVSAPAAHLAEPSAPAAPSALAGVAPAAPAGRPHPGQPSLRPGPVLPAPPAGYPAPGEGRTGEWEALSPMRRAIAEHMVRSVSTAPHVTTCFEIDMTGVARAREPLQAAFRAREGFELTYLPFVAKAVVEALREHPILNASYEAGEGGQAGIRRHGAINLGVAMGLENGLVVPVVRDADGLSVVGIARAVRVLVERARAGKLTLEDVRGGTLTLNNTGAFGSITSNPIINQGQAGIITMEAIVRRPVVVARDGEETIAIRSMMYSCLTFDHRVLDGLQAGRFMQSLKRRLEAIGPGTAIDR